MVILSPWCLSCRKRIHSHFMKIVFFGGAKDLTAMWRMSLGVFASRHLLHAFRRVRPCEEVRREDFAHGKKYCTPAAKISAWKPAHYLLRVRFERALSCGISLKELFTLLSHVPGSSRHAQVLVLNSRARLAPVCEDYLHRGSSTSSPSRENNVFLKNGSCSKEDSKD